MGMSLGQFISIRRKRMLMTQEELAKKTNVSKSAIAKWETDGGIPDRDNLYKLANILGVTVNDMHQIIRSMKYKDIDKELEEMANMYQMELDKVKEALGDAGREQVAKDVANKKAVDFIVKNAVEVEKADEEAEKEDK